MKRLMTINPAKRITIMEARINFRTVANYAGAWSSVDYWVLNTAVS